MLLTIITINYNNVAGLKKTLGSIKNQSSVFELEHVIVDGGSLDGSSELAESYCNAASSRILISEPDTGIYNAMNKGITIAGGDYIAFLNSGDVLFDQSVLRKILDVVESDPSIDMVYGDIDLVNTNMVLKRRWNSGFFTKTKLYFGWIPPHPMTLIKQNFFKEHGGFDESFKIAADYDLMLRALLKANLRVVYLPQTLVSQEIGGVSNGSLKGILKANSEVLRSWLKAKGVLIPYWIFFTKPLSKILQFCAK